VERSDRPQRADSDRPQRADSDRPERAERPVTRTRRPREPVAADEPRIDFAVIPPAIGVVAEVPQPEAAEEAPAPRRRVRRPRPDSDTDIAPAA